MTIRELAAACGVSVGTASQALRGHGSVAAETAARVLAMAERLGYAPDPAAARLASRRFHLAQSREGLTVLLLRAEQAQVDLKVARIRAGELGYQCRYEVMPDEASKLPARLRRWRTQGVAGIVFQRLLEPVPTELKEWRDFALIASDRVSVAPPCDVVRVSMSETVWTCWRRLRERGYRRIGAVFPRHGAGIHEDDLREAAATLMRARDQAGEAPPPVFVEPGTEAELRLGVRAWFDQHRPDAVIGAHPGVFYWLKDSGLVCPRDFAFATLRTNPTVPRIAGTDALADECERAMVELLDQMIRHKQTGWPELRRTILLPARWRDAATAPPKAEAPFRDAVR